MTMARTASTAGLELTESERELSDRARRFTEDVLLPREELAERNGGRLPDEDVAEIKRAAIDSGLAGGRHTVDHGGQGWNAFESFIVNEQFGRVTNGLHWHVPQAYNVLADGTSEQIDRYLRPALRGEGDTAYAVTEERSGSDPSTIETTATRTDGGWVIDGEKWFVTSADVAIVMLVMAVAVDGDERLPTLFLVDPSAPGVEIVDDPPFTHNYPHGHPTVAFRRVEVPDDAILGGLGAGDELQRRWFTEERLGIATHGLGAMWRLIDEATAWALAREQGGQRILDYQGVSFPLADSATDAAAGRLLTMQVARLVDAEAPEKVVHAKASMAKLFVSEAACRAADRAVQIFGGRGYMRTNPAERFLRELRVDRIWEGTSEIQRLIVARALERRGVEATIH
jgi:acyl-CoA dehydrogenase